VKILVCDDHELFRAGLAQALADLDPDAELLHAATGEAALSLADANPDLALALVDFQLPDTDGLVLLARLRERHPALPAVMISASEEGELVRAALARGAAGFIPKSSKRAVLLGALRIVLEGEVYVPLAAIATEPTAARRSPGSGTRSLKRADTVLTPRQLEIARLIARGLTNREISDVLGIAPGTVKAHVVATFEALDVSNRTEAAMVLRELGLDEEG
jgi:DNA-binding NarL/FixJ family response regulator